MAHLGSCSQVRGRKREREREGEPSSFGVEGAAFCLKASWLENSKARIKI